jgi:hypothetical protein
LVPLPPSELPPTVDSSPSAADPRPSWSRRKRRITKSAQTAGSWLLSAPFPQARLPFEAFPSSTAGFRVTSVPAPSSLHGWIVVAVAVACFRADGRVDLEAFWHGIMTPWMSPLPLAGLTRRSARCSLGLSARPAHPVQKHLVQHIRRVGACARQLDGPRLRGSRCCLRPAFADRFDVSSRRSLRLGWRACSTSKSVPVVQSVDPTAPFRTSGS